MKETVISVRKDEKQKIFSGEMSTIRELVQESV